MQTKFLQTLLLVTALASSTATTAMHADKNGDPLPRIGASPAQPAHPADGGPRPADADEEAARPSSPPVRGSAAAWNLQTPAERAASYGRLLSEAIRHMMPHPTPHLDPYKYYWIGTDFLGHDAVTVLSWVSTYENQKPNTSEMWWGPIEPTWTGHPHRATDDYGSYDTVTLNATRRPGTHQPGIHITDYGTEVIIRFSENR